MADATTVDLHRAADRAAEEGDFWTALRCAGDIVHAAPTDHRARTKLALSLAALGRADDAVRALEVGARDLVRRGFVLSALGMARDALSFEPDDRGVWSCLAEAHAHATPGERARVPPPVPPALAVTERPFLAVDDRSELLDRAAALGATRPGGEAVAGPHPLPLFADLNGDAFAATMAEIELRKLRAGTQVVREGEPGDALYVIVRGEVEVHRDGTLLAVLGAGSFFGELSLFLNKPRSATVTTRQPTELFVLSRTEVERIADEHPSFSEDLAGFARRRLLANVLATSPIFEPFAGDDKRQFLSAFESHVVPAGETVIREGGASPGLFVIVEGQVQVVKSDGDEPVVVAHLGPGDVFGEIALVLERPATASVVTSESCMLLQLPRGDFSGVARARPEAKAYLDGLTETRLAELRSAHASPDAVLNADDLVIV
jgi:CRP-like cAMP-binding protein